MNKLTIDYLKQALSLAELHRGFCAPNPCVGAIVVKDKKIIASGYHLGSSFPHAEAEALNKIDSQLAKDATLYVTLQPCCHTAKKTPPCTQLLIEKGIAKVIYGFRDPNPAVENQTDIILKQAGISCTYHPIPEIDRFYTSYKFWWQHKRPFVTAKLAISLDGKIAGQNGQRIQLTGEIAQHFTHQQRKKADALLTTVKTICNDNPLLNVRTHTENIAKPVYILDSELHTPLLANVFNKAKNVTIFYKAGLDKKKHEKHIQNNVRLVPIKHSNQGLNLLEALKQIGKDGYHDLWIEAGGHCLQSFAINQLLQRAFIYVAPYWLGQTAQIAFTYPDVLSTSKSASPIFLGPDVCFEFNWYTK
ncbi:MAG: bifunctional diaminohydroxyphosphoribosylaminopyrimidine deaminase/5-amino-6-(5-phosphoribosylamino)uracil reductase RibD [Rickettsiella sp.]|nr:bifunctional diaminohydroxyphosphoribosylaminopyrimidine deaminase/5-amino-6-(5-phosphoribosylamino)uracil reductase RibD [Rickettsiella sp.]